MLSEVEEDMWESFCKWYNATSNQKGKCEEKNKIDRVLREVERERRNRKRLSLVQETVHKKELDNS